MSTKYDKDAFHYVDTVYVTWNGYSQYEYMVLQAVFFITYFFFCDDSFQANDSEITLSLN